MLRRLHLLVPIALVACFQPALGEAEPSARIAGPVEARVVRVLDGDTILADAFVWPGQVVRVSVRIRGIDAPEIRSRCEAEKERGIAARAALEEILHEGTLHLTAIGGDKYFGRVLADVHAAERDLAEEMLRRGLVRPYGGGRREQAC